MWVGKISGFRVVVQFLRRYGILGDNPQKSRLQFPDRRRSALICGQRGVTGFWREKAPEIISSYRYMFAFIFQLFSPISISTR